MSNNVAILSVDGIVSTTKKINATIHAVGTISGTIMTASPIIAAVPQIAPTIPDDNLYEGPYEVTPKAYEVQTLETGLKYLTNNITIKKVPYSKVDMPDGGSVIYIASEIQYE